jgi:hypothetical protein
MQFIDPITVYFKTEIGLIVMNPFIAIGLGLSLLKIAQKQHDPNQKKDWALDACMKPVNAFNFHSNSILNADFRYKSTNFGDENAG